MAFSETSFMSALNGIDVILNFQMKMSFCSNANKTKVHRGRFCARLRFKIDEIDISRKSDSLRKYYVALFEGNLGWVLQRIFASLLTFDGRSVLHFEILNATKDKKIYISCNIIQLIPQRSE